MTEKLAFELCPETGICSIVRSDKGKIDLMPDEVVAIREAAGDAAQVQAVLAESDRDFAARLSPEELAQIGKTLS
ncbi:MAG TPA: hypothetical protein VGL77_02760 [Armatimonadota bacterium]|jgi:uncharacterized iron-regulated membrane protein